MPATTLVETARVIGGYAWMEERLFETLGAWVREVPEPLIKLHLAAASHQHAWHASLWRQRLPALQEPDASALAVPADRGVAAAVAALRASASTAEKLAGLYRVLLPRQVATYQRHLDEASAIADGPVIRALGLVLADDRAEVLEGERLLGMI